MGIANFDPNSGILMFGPRQVRYTKDSLGNLWFVARDVVNALSVHRRQLTTRAVRDDERRAVVFQVGARSVLLDCISQTGFFKLFLRTEIPEMSRMRDWIGETLFPYLFGEDYMINLAPLFSGDQNPAKAITLNLKADVDMEPAAEVDSELGDERFAGDDNDLSDEELLLLEEEAEGFVREVPSNEDVSVVEQSPFAAGRQIDF